jgi:hypothetical protein
VNELTMNYKTIRLFAAAALTLAAALPSFANSATYPYGGTAFTQLVADSDRATGGGTTPAQFYHWMDQSPLAKQSHGLLALTDAERHKLAGLHNPAQKTAEERAFCATLHHSIKTWIPRFSLDTGFEFVDAMKLGTRQCLLQSVLLSGLLQRAGMDAGMAMVWRNISGTDINDGHAICLVHLPDGHAVELDASDPVPFVRHQGLLAWKGGPRDVNPVFAGDSTTIIGFRATGDGVRLSVSEVRPLTLAYVRSQFYYYRGERAPGGLLAAKITPAGLNLESQYLRDSIHFCPQNQLSVYMLGHVYLKQGNVAAARRQVVTALRLYADAGWIPQGARDLASDVKSAHRSVVSSLP